MKLSKITIRGKYIGANERGLIVGGVLLLPGMPATLLMVDEDTYKFLLAGQKSGWFKIEKDNYESFCISRERIKYESPQEVKPPLVSKPEEDNDSPSVSEPQEDVDSSSQSEEERDPEVVEAKVKKTRRTTKKKEVAE